MKKALAVFILSLCFSAMQAQTKLDSLKALGRDSLIKLAVKKINDPKFDPAQYDLISVRTDGKRLLVEFSLSVQLISGNSCYYDSYTVALFGGGGNGSITGDCNDVKYYHPSSSDKKNIAFVFDAINKSDEIGHIPGNKMDAGSTMTITEHSTYFYVEVSSWSTYSHYKISKGTGKISEAEHKHYDRSGEKESEFVEIK
jgi:hypothetical protein